MTIDQFHEWPALLLVLLAEPLAVAVDLPLQQWPHLPLRSQSAWVSNVSVVWSRSDEPLSLNVLCFEYAVAEIDHGFAELVAAVSDAR